MSRPGPAYIGPAAPSAPPASASADQGGTSSRWRPALAGVGIFAGIRLLALGVSAFLLPRGKFQTLHYSLWHLIASWDSVRYLTIAAHGYSYVPGNLRLDVIFAWFPGYPAAIDTVSWIPGVGTDRAALAVTIAAGLAAAWGLTRLGLALTGDRRISLLMVALWAVAPGSLVWTMLYSEALFCALAVWALVNLVERHWLSAAGLTILAGTVRSTAIALIAAIAVAALPPVIRAVRASEPIGAWWRPAVATVAAPLGLGHAPRSRVWLGREERAQQLRRGQGHHPGRQERDHLRAERSDCADPAGDRGRRHLDRLQPDRAHSRLPARLHAGGGRAGPHPGTLVPGLQAALPAARHAARPAAGPPPGPGPDLGPDPADRRAGRRVHLVQHLPDDHRPA